MLHKFITQSSSVTLLFCIMLIMPAAAQNKISITFVGASITWGVGVTDRAHDAYPARLQTLLGNGYQVANFGVSGCTMLRQGDQPYWNTPAYKQALVSRPDIVFIDLGGNDSKLINRIHAASLVQDARDMVASFTRLPTHPRVVLLLPLASFVDDTSAIWDKVIVNTIIPPLQQAALEERVEVVDLHSATINKGNLFPDKIHPNTDGAAIIAGRLYALLNQQRDTTYNIFSHINQQLTKSAFYGYVCADFSYNSRKCKIVQPKWSAPGHPWVWRARFWGHEPQTDIALLEHGFHIVYCDVAELLGNKESNGYWNKFYAFVHSAGLGAKAVMEGMSRGGVYVFNWAAENAGKVAAVYVDNPLLNINSWALPVMRQPNAGNDMLNAFKADYNISDTIQLRKFASSPVNKVKEIVQGHYPILILCADEDEAVIPAENTLLFESNVKALNGSITVIHKPGFKHHPHSLPNPAPIVDFILKATGYYNNITPVK